MPKGKESPDGTTRVSQNGYHYTKRKGTWVLTHRLVAEATLGRKLAEDERVRFKDNNRTNLDPANLRVVKVTNRTPGAKRARLEAKIEELQAELEGLDA